MDTWPEVIANALEKGTLRSHDIVHVAHGAFQIELATSATDRPQYDGFVRARFFERTATGHYEERPAQRFEGTQRTFAAHARALIPHE